MMLHTILSDLYQKSRQFIPSFVGFNTLSPAPTTSNNFGTKALWMVHVLIFHFSLFGTLTFGHFSCQLHKTSLGWFWWVDEFIASEEKCLIAPVSLSLTWYLACRDQSSKLLDASMLFPVRRHNCANFSLLVVNHACGKRAFWKITFHISSFVSLPVTHKGSVSTSVKVAFACMLKVR